MLFQVYSTNKKKEEFVEYGVPIVKKKDPHFIEDKIRHSLSFK